MGKQNDLYSKWYWNQEPTSSLARLMVHCYRNDVSLVPIIYGDPRIGKSGYIEKVGYQVLNHLYGFTDPLRIHKLTMGHDPIEVIKAWRNIMRPTHNEPLFRKYKLPYFIWDDGGIFLFSGDYQKKDVKLILKYVQIIFTKVQVLPITTPTPKNIASGIRIIPSAIWIKITRRDGGYSLAELPPSKRYARLAKGYDPWITPDLAKLRVNRALKDRFDCRMPDIVYKYYQPTRAAYTMEFEDHILHEALEDQGKDEDTKTRRDKLNMIDAAIIEAEDHR